MEVVFSVVYHPIVVHEDILALDRVWKTRIKTMIEKKLATAPDIFGIPLRRSLHGHRKLRVGDYRTVFRIEKKTVLILAILHRSVVYLQMTKRLK